MSKASEALSDGQLNEANGICCNQSDIIITDGQQRRQLQLSTSKCLRSSNVVKILLVYAMIATAAAIIVLILYSSKQTDNINDLYSNRRILVKSSHSASQGITYLLSKQDSNGGWSDVTLTAQVTIALRLAGGIDASNIRKSCTHSLSVNEYFTAVIKQNYKYQDNPTINTGQLAYVVLALQALCKNTSNFADVDLRQKLISGIRNFPSDGFIHHYAYSLALLSACISGAVVDESLVSRLEHMQLADGSWSDVDTTALAILALNCIQGSSNVIGSGIKFILSKQSQTTYQFGNEYTTAHAIQALLSQKIPAAKWYYLKVIEGLMQYKTSDGSFGRIDNTATVLPSMISAIFMDIKKVQCIQSDSNDDSKFVTITYTVRYRCLPYVSRPDERSIVITSQSGTNMLEFMQIARSINLAYSFSTKYYPSFNAHLIQEINNITSAVSNNTCFWLLYDDITNKKVTLGVSLFKPQNDAKISFIYTRN